MKAEQAILDSIRKTDIVTLRNLDTETYHEVRDALALESEGSVVNGDVVEYWGTDEDGDEWRVHVARYADFAGKL